MAVSIKRVYEPPAESDGKRILIDRLWPRGLTKERAAVDVWLKGVAPSTELRKWFAHDPEKWAVFQQNYRVELEGNPAFSELKSIVASGKVTLVYGARDEVHNDAVVLQQLLDGGT